MPWRHIGVGGGCIASYFLDLSTRRRWVVNFMPRLLYIRGKSPQYPLKRRLSGLQNQSVHGGEEKNSLPQPRIKPQNPNCQAHNQFLNWLSYSSSQWKTNCHIEYLIMHSLQEVSETNALWGHHTNLASCYISKIILYGFWWYLVLGVYNEINFVSYQSNTIIST